MIPGVIVLIMCDPRKAPNILALKKLGRGGRRGVEGRSGCDEWVY